MSNTSRLMQAAAAGAPGNQWTLNSVEVLSAPLGRMTAPFFGFEDMVKIVWKTDGSSFFALDGGNNGTEIREYTGGSDYEAFPALEEVSPTNRATLQDVNQRGLVFKPDGTKFYFTASTLTTRKIYEYDMSPAWDLSSATLNQSFDPGFSELPTLFDLFISSDGLNLFFLAGTGQYTASTLYSYEMSTAWDISTATSVDDISASGVNSVFFKPDGTQFFLLFRSSSTVNVRSYPLSTAWDLSTIGSAQSFLDANWLKQGGSGTPSFFEYMTFMTFNADGTKMYLGSTNGSSDLQTLFQYDLSTAWDLSTASRQYPASNYFSFNSNFTTNYGKEGLVFKPDGTRFFVVDSQTDTVNQYDLSYPYDITTSVLDGSLDSNLSFADDVALSFDGSLLFVLDGDEVETWTLSTPWDVTTGTLLRTTDLGDTSFAGLFFKDDGSKLYTCSTDTLYQFSLSTPWDLSTATLDGSSSPGDSSSFFRSLRFNNGGNKIILQSSTEAFGEITCTTPWDVTSGTTLTQTYSTLAVADGKFSSREIGVRPDGKRIYQCLRGADYMIEYKLED